MKLILVIFLFSVFSYSQVSQTKSDHELKDLSSDQALLNTQNILRDKKQRDQIIQTDSQAKGADDNLTQMFGEGAMKENVYDTSAQVIKFVSEKNSGDSAKMQAEILKALTDPASFMKSLPPDIQKRIRELASDYEAKKKNP